MKSVLVALLLCAGLSQAQPHSSLSLKTRIALPNVNGRIDHLSADLKGRRLFMSALGNGSVEVLDIQSGKQIHSITNLAEPQGVLYDQATDRLFAACARDGATKLFDGLTYRLLQTARFPGDADNLRLEFRNRRIVVGYGDGGLGLIDPDGKRTGDIPLDAHPESFQLERAGTRVFVNVPDRQEIEVADVAKRSVIAKWPVTSALKNYPMALDEDHNRLLIGCRAPARMLVINAETGKQTGSVEIVGDTDDLFYDAANGRVYVIGGEGFVDAFDQNDADHYVRIAHIPTAPGARTGLFVPEWNRLFVAAPRRGARSAEVLVYSTNGR